MKIRLLLSFTFVTLFILSCQKDDFALDDQNPKETISQKRHLNYTGIRPVVLGQEFLNPYEIDIVNEAYLKLYPHKSLLSATHVCKVLTTRPSRSS